MASSPRRRVVEAPSRERPELRAVRVIFEEDPHPDVSYLEQEDFAERLVEYRRGAFRFVGVHAEAEVVISGIAQTLTSSGLWGIESDTEQDELDDLAGQEWWALRGVLKTVGVPTSQLPSEINVSWIEWRT